MDYDGQSECVLNMNQLLFSYEVLCQHMFHFLLGRYSLIVPCPHFSLAHFVIKDNHLHGVHCAEPSFH